MASDLTFNDDSVAVWLRSPKVFSSATGAVVEVWRVNNRIDLDPVIALERYLGLRKDRFGGAPALSVFLHENGAIYSKQELNRDLKELLELFPELSTDRDKWTGHSFRSGISTVLAILGFSKVGWHLPTKNLFFTFS